MELFGSEITPMSKGTFYFILVILVVIDVVQGRYQKKLMDEKSRISKMERFCLCNEPLYRFFSSVTSFLAIFCLSAAFSELLAGIGASRNVLMTRLFATGESTTV